MERDSSEAGARQERHTSREIQAQYKLVYRNWRQAATIPMQQEVAAAPIQRSLSSVESRSTTAWELDRVPHTPHPLFAPAGAVRMPGIGIRRGCIHPGRPYLLRAEVLSSCPRCRPRPSGSQGGPWRSTSEGRTYRHTRAHTHMQTGVRNSYSTSVMRPALVRSPSGVV